MENKRMAESPLDSTGRMGSSGFRSYVVLDKGKVLTQDDLAVLRQSRMTKRHLEARHSELVDVQGPDQEPKKVHDLAHFAARSHFGFDLHDPEDLSQEEG